MSQDRESGAEASRYGHDCGKRIIKAVGARGRKGGINESLLDGELPTVHCARKDADSVGVTYKIWRESLRYSEHLSKQMLQYTESAHHCRSLPPRSR